MTRTAHEHAHEHATEHHDAHVTPAAVMAVLQGLPDRFVLSVILTAIPFWIVIYDVFRNPRSAPSSS